MPKITFGKYSGLDLEDVPLDYLTWLRDTRKRDFDDYSAEIDRRALLETVSLSLTERIVSEGYRSLAKRMHPDVGGNASEFRQLQAAYEQLKVAAKEIQKIQGGGQMP